MDWTYEIIDALEDTYDGKDEESLYVLASALNELYQSTGDKDYKREIDRLCEEYDLCPHCYGKLIDVKVGEQSLEYCGSRVYMDEYERVCTRCGTRY